MLSGSADKTKIGFVFALREEARGLARVLSESRSSFTDTHGHAGWSIGRIQVLVSTAGIGAEHAARATRGLIDAGAQLVVSAGLAAGLDPAVQLGDVVVADRVLTAAGGAAPIECSRNIICSIPPSGKFGFVVRHGSVATSDVAVCTASEKSRIFRATGAVALDMESYAVGEECGRANVPFGVVRSISDRADEDLPEAIAWVAAMKSTARAIGFVAASPSLWLPLFRLRRQSRLAAANLGEILGLMVLRVIR